MVIKNENEWGIVIIWFDNGVFMNNSKSITNTKKFKDSYIYIKHWISNIKNIHQQNSFNINFNPYNN